MKQIRHHFLVRPVDTPELSIRGFGVQEAISSSFVNRPMGIETYLMVYFYDEVMITINDIDKRFPSGTFILWEPNVKHNFGNAHSRWRHSWILMEGQFIGDVIRRLKIPCNVPFPAMISGMMEKIFLDIEYEVANHHPASLEIVRDLLHIFFLELHRTVYPSPSNRSIPPGYLAVKEYMDQNFDIQISLDQLAAKIHRSTARFCVTFKKYFGIPPIDYLIHLRMNQAEFLLKDYNLSISEIADRVGYDDLYYFSRLFKKHFGISPSLMRKRLIEGRG